MKKLILPWIFAMLFFVQPALSYTDQFLLANSIILWRADDTGVVQNDAPGGVGGALRGSPTKDTTNYFIGTGSGNFISEVGVGEYVTYDVPPYTNFTFEGWLRRPNADGDHMYFGGNQLDGSQVGEWRIRLDISTPAHMVFMWEGISVDYIPPSEIFTGNHFNHFCAVINQTGVAANAYLYINGTLVAAGSEAIAEQASTINVSIGGEPSDIVTLTRTLNGNMDTVGFYNFSFRGEDCQRLYDLGKTGGTLSDTIPPEIKSYNMTSSSGGCTNWNTNKNNACETSDTTPTVFITTDEDANCAIGVSDLNYTGLGVNRACSGSGSKEHTCTLIPNDELTGETSYIYIGCQDYSLLNENRTSTSGALKVYVSTNNIEANGRNNIETGIQSALSSGYTIYTDQKIYARNSANQQSVGVFDKVVKWMNKIWAFNYITGNQSYVSMFNITPVLYTLEINTTATSINNTVYQFILGTK